MLIVYDDQCPMCASYMRLIRLKKSVGEVTFISARSNAAQVCALQRSGYDLNAGMVVVLNGVVYHSAEALHVLGLLTTNSNFFNRLNNFIFSYRWAAKLIYPIFRLGRRLILRINRIAPVKHL